MATTTVPTIKTRICIISDTHSAIPWPPGDSEHAFRTPLPPADLLLHAGDFTKDGRLYEHEATLELLKNASAELKIVIPGNHDITLDEEFYASQWNRFHGSNYREEPAACMDLYTNEAAVAAGIVLIKEGIQTFRLRSGAKFTVYASAYQPNYSNWAFAYERHEDRYNRSSKYATFTASCPIPDHPAIDIMLTHGPPYGILDRTVRTKENVGCQNLRKAVQRCKPRLHAFGHVHEGWGIAQMDWDQTSLTEIAVGPDEPEVLAAGAAMIDVSGSAPGTQALRWGRETLFVNASIMNVQYKPHNAPWIIDLDLPMDPS